MKSRKIMSVVAMVAISSTLLPCTNVSAKIQNQNHLIHKPLCGQTTILKKL